MEKTNCSASIKPSLGHYWPTRETPSKWRLVGRLKVALFYMPTGMVQLLKCLSLFYNESKFLDSKTSN